MKKTLRITSDDIPKNVFGALIFILVEKAGGSVFIPDKEILESQIGKKHLGTFTTPKGIFFKILDHEPTAEDIIEEELPNPGESIPRDTKEEL